MARNSGRTIEFYVVQFIDLPFEGIDDYVCVPFNWLIVRRPMAEKYVVTYPKDEDPFVTRDRVKRKERYNDAWKFYLATVKYESDTYRNAETWIATRNDHTPLVKKELNATGSGSPLSNFQPQLDNVRSLPNVNDDHKLLVSKVSSNELSINGTRRLAVAAQNSSNLINQTRSLSTRSVEQPLVVNQNQIDQQVLKMHTGKSRDQTASLRSIPISSQEIQVPTRRINIERSNDVAAVDPKNALQSVTNFAATSQQLPSSSHKRSNYVRRSDGHQNSLAHEQYFTHSHPNQYLPTNQGNFKQEPLSGSIEGNSYDHRPTSRTIKLKIPSIEQNLTHLSNPIQYQTSELPKQRQSQPNQQDSQRQPQRPKTRIGISIKRKNKTQMPTLQGVTKKTQRQGLSTNHNNFILSQQQLQPRLSAKSTEDNNIALTTDSQNIATSATSDKHNTEIPIRSFYHAVTSDSDADTDQEVILDHEMSTDETPVETSNNFNCIANHFGCSSAVRPTAAQNSMSTNHQTHPRVILEQQMLDNFGILLTQMNSTLRYTCDMYNNLRGSILVIAKTYKKLLGAVEQFNAMQFSEERHTEVTANASSSNQNQLSNDFANKPLEKQHENLWRFVLPPEYDPHDTRWTLKYRKNLPGLVELMPQSGIHVSYGELKYCQKVSKDCRSLAQRLLPEVFNRQALSVCLSMVEKAQGPNTVGSNIRPELDEQASTVLLNFVLEHGLQRGWNTDLKPILSTLHKKIQRIRFKYGVMVKC